MNSSVYPYFLFSYPKICIFILFSISFLMRESDTKSLCDQGRKIVEHSLACKFTDYLCKRNIINEDYYDVYVYGSELTLSFIITVALVFIAGCFAGDLPSSIVFLTAFILLRRFTGGYHANTYYKCKVITVFAFLISLFASRIIHTDLWMYVVLFAVGNVIIHFLGPVENPNKPLNENEKKKYRRLSHLMFSIIIVLGLLIYLSFPVSNDILFFSLLSVLILMIIPNIMKGGTRDENESCKKNGRYRS